MIGDVIDMFRNTTTVVNQKFVQKVKLRQVPVTESLFKKLISQSCLFMLRNFAAQCLGSLSTKQCENEQVKKYPPKRAPTLYD